jgi:TolB-like protein/cytochrome c-type biogenesis protein CcmH/NrfG
MTAPRASVSSNLVGNPAGTLTERQREVLDLLAKGLSNREIAGALGISPSTVKTHVENLLRALDATNRTEAAALVHELTAQTAAAHDAFTDRPAVAVLRFAVEADDPHARTFAAGLADDLITLLCKWRWFPVIARSTSMFHASDQPAARLRELTGADYLIGGSVTRRGARLRVTTQLDDARREQCLWSERFELSAEDVFEIQDEVAAAVVGRAYPELFRAEGRAARRVPPGELTAWHLAHDGLLHLDSRVRDDTERALALFDQALARDPRFVLPLYGKGFGIFHLVANQWTDRVSEHCAELHRCAERALALDESDAAGWVLTGRAAMTVGDFASAIPALERATAQNPSHASGHALLGQARIVGGDQTGFASLELAARLSPRAYASGLAFAHFAAGSYAEAASACRTALVTRPDYIFGHALLCSALALGGDTHAARAERRRLLELNPDFRTTNIQSAIPSGKSDTADRMVQGLRLAGLRD